MNKKIMAVAVAGALAAPGLALAQASVTISGFVKVAVGQQSISTSQTAAGVSSRAGLNTSDTRLSDDGPTRIEFDMRDQIDSNLAGIAKLSLRPTIDGNSGVGGAGFGSSSGTAYVGLESKDMGTIRLGSIDQHYTVTVDTGATYAPTEVSSGALMGYSYIAQPVQGVSRYSTVMTSEAGASRTRNLIRWDSPNWNGFRLGVGYSTGTTAGSESDLLSGVRKGQSLNINPTYTADTWRVMYSYFDDRRDPTLVTGVGPGPTVNDWKGNRLAGDVKLGDFTLGAVWDSMKGEKVTLATGAKVDMSKRTAWALTGKYQTGKHVVTAMYAKADKDKVLVGETGAKEYSLSYAYLFSARTSVGLGYAVLKNDTLGAYTLSNTSTTNNVTSGYGSTGAEAIAGEKLSYFGVTLRQAF